MFYVFNKLSDYLREGKGRSGKGGNSSEIRTSPFNKGRTCEACFTFFTSRNLQDKKRENVKLYYV